MGPRASIGAMSNHDTDDTLIAPLTPRHDKPITTALPNPPPDPGKYGKIAVILGDVVLFTTALDERALLAEAVSFEARALGITAENCDRVILQIQLPTR